MPASILVCRRIFPDVVARLREHFEVESNDADDVWSRDELIRRLQGKDGVFVTGTQAIDAALLDACPQLRAVCSLAVGGRAPPRRLPPRARGGPPRAGQKKLRGAGVPRARRRCENPPGGAPRA